MKEEAKNDEENWLVVSYSAQSEVDSGFHGNDQSIIDSCVHHVTDEEHLMHSVLGTSLCCQSECFNKRIKELEVNTTQIFELTCV